MENNEKRYIEKRIKKYVIANMDGKYLKKTVGKNEYCFVDDIEVATKAIKINVINDVLKYYYYDTGMNIELVILPIEITYELIDETN